MPDTDVSERNAPLYSVASKIKKNKDQLRSAVFNVLLAQDENIKAVFVTRWYIIGCIFLYSDSLRAFSPLFLCL